MTLQKKKNNKKIKNHNPNWLRIPDHTNSRNIRKYKFIIQFNKSATRY